MSNFKDSIPRLCDEEGNPSCSKCLFVNYWSDWTYDDPSDDEYFVEHYECNLLKVGIGDKPIPVKECPIFYMQPSARIVEEYEKKLCEVQLEYSKQYSKSKLNYSNLELQLHDLERKYLEVSKLRNESLEYIKVIENIQKMRKSFRNYSIADDDPDLILLKEAVHNDSVHDVLTIIGKYLGDNVFIPNRLALKEDKDSEVAKFLICHFNLDLNIYDSDSGQCWLI